ncbi:MAG: hypothetical protein KF680_07040 [Cryobacterium sp.]|nr:hypothetical protein [Cryobacterium sp.]
MSDEHEEALSWGDERDPTFVSSKVAKPAKPSAATDPVARTAMSSALLIFYGALAGVYVLYTVGWVLAALGDTTPSVSVFAQLMHEFGLFCAIAAPALWAIAVFVLARRPATRAAGLAIGALVLVPWPFVLGGLT